MPIYKARVNNTYPELSTYTPSITNLVNVSVATPGVANVIRYNANSARVFGTINLTLGLISLATSFRISLPYASNFASASDCVGDLRCRGLAISLAPVTILADPTNDVAIVEFNASALLGILSSNTCSYDFVYKII